MIACREKSLALQPSTASNKPCLAPFQDIFEQSTIGICTLNVRGEIQDANQSIEGILGFSRQALKGKSLISFSHPEDNELENTCFQELLGQKKTQYTLEKRYLYQGKTITWCTVTVSQAKSSSSKEPLFIAQLIEITERKKLELELKKRAAELSRSNDELAQFAYTASHDLNEPLDKIASFGKLLKSECGHLLTDAGSDYLEYMQNSAKRMQKLIASLLQLSKVSTHGCPFEQVDLNQIVQDVISDFKLRIDKKNVNIMVEELPVIEADPIQMRQLFQNLIGNALKFQLGEVVPQIHITGSTSIFSKKNPSAGAIKNLCQIRVKDNGIGFEPRFAKRIFDILQRIHPRQKYEGAGIGLSICRKIVDRHNGKIKARSQIGEGTIFIVTLPISQKLIKSTVLTL